MTEADKGLSSQSECLENEERLFDYLTGELDAEQRLAVEAHIESCRHCKARLIELKAAVTLLKDNEFNESALHLKKGQRKWLKLMAAHPIFDFVYSYRHIIAWFVAFLIAAIVILIGYSFRYKPDTVIYWINL